MAEARARTLLDFAIAASLAVLPIMLVMLLLVAWIRPHDHSPTHAAGRADRYVSVRHLAALQTFEQAIGRRQATTALTPTAGDVIAGLPQCRGDWEPSWSASASLRALLGRADTSAASQAERIAAQVGALDLLLLRFGARANPRVATAVGFDLARWFEAAGRALATPLEVPGYDGLRFRMGCADLAAAVTALTRSDGRMLEALAWRGTAAAATVARWRPDQMVAVSARDVARHDPWSGVTGCIYLGARTGASPTHMLANARSAQERLCALPTLAGASAPRPAVLTGEPRPGMPVSDDRWRVPPSLHTLLQPLEGLRRPSSPLYRLYTGATAQSPELPTGYRFGPNRVVLDGAPIDIGFSIDLTIDPTLQELAQKTAACYSGRHDVCQALGIRRAEDRGQAVGHRLLEGAMVRMAAIAIVDVASGRIEALAGALSPCARQEVDGPGRGADCDRRMPYPVQYRPDALFNPAVYHDAMPASTIKPIMAAAFLADNEVGARWLLAERVAMKRAAVPPADSLRSQLMRSDSARFLDRMFCFDKRFADCARPWHVQATARTFGWNIGCDVARADCGKHDLLFGRAVDATAEAGAVQPLATTVAYGRLLSEPASGRLGAMQHAMQRVTLDPSIVSRCALGADGRRLSDDDWEKCRGGSVVDVVAEGWGQGHARSSALGVAGMMATLAAAANGQTEVQRPHLVESLRGVGNGDAVTLKVAIDRWSLAPAQPVPLARPAAEVILDGLSWGHRAGTSRSACEQVFDATTCRRIGWIAGKTGTPSFPGDPLSLDDIARLCRHADGGPRARHPACGALRPYKWYVAAYRTDPKGGPWTKAIGVLTERNWLIDGGHVHGAGDHGPNPAAEIALHIVGRQLGLIAGTAP